MSQDALTVVRPRTTLPQIVNSSGTQMLMHHHQRLLSELELEVLTGTERGRRYQLQPGRQKFGRERDNAIPLQDRSISAHHGTIEYSREGQITVFDAASTNGISVKGKTAPVVTLRPRDVLQIGSIYLRLQRPGSALSIPSSKRSLFAPITSAILLAGALLLFPSDRGIKPSLPIAMASVAPRKVMKQRPIRLNITQKIEKQIQRAQVAFEEQDFRTAYLMWKQIEQMDPENLSVKQSMAEFFNIARRKYEEALMMASSSPQEAKKLLALVLDITPPQAELHRKAEELLQKGSLS